MELSKNYKLIMSIAIIGIVLGQFLPWIVYFGSTNVLTLGKLTGVDLNFLAILPLLTILDLLIATFGKNPRPWLKAGLVLALLSLVPLIVFTIGKGPLLIGGWLTVLSLISAFALCIQGLSKTKQN